MSEPREGAWPHAGMVPAPNYQQPQYDPQQPYGQQPQYNSQPQHGQQDPQQQYSYPPPAQDPIFQVTTMTHTGLMVFWFNQRHTFRGTYAQCDSALRSAQMHCYILGWWSFLSILLMNWIAIGHNSSARKKLNYDAQQAHAYAQWWYQYIAPNHGPQS